MLKAAFVGFGEVNSPRDMIERKCQKAEEDLKKQGLELVSVWPVTDDYEEKDIHHALDVLAEQDFDCLILCIAG